MFYGDRLECGKPEQLLPSDLKDMWPGGTSYPIAFVDIRGEEKAQVITTADGNEQSKYNSEEAEYTVCILYHYFIFIIIRAQPINCLTLYHVQVHCFYDRSM